MALSEQRKQRIIELLATGLTAREVAADVGCSESSVNRVKKLSKNDNLVKIGRRALAEKTLDAQGVAMVRTIKAMAEREPAMQEQLWVMFEGLATLFNSVLAQTSAEDVSPRMLPGLAKAAAEMAGMYADFSDRINGLTELAHEVERLS